MIPHGYDYRQRDAALSMSEKPSLPDLPHSPVLAPSLLAGRHIQLAQSAHKIRQSGAPWIHLDIMDGHFVPNLTFGPQVVAELRSESPLFFDVHLMIENPYRHVEAFAKAGADLISIHVEPHYPPKYPLRKILQSIRDLGCQNGIALNPKTPADTVFPYLTEVDLVLVMSVEPGFGGQSFDTTVLPKIAQLHTSRQKESYSYRLEVDGGIDEHTARTCAEHGADTFVAGTAFFNAKDPRHFAEGIRS